MVTELENQLNVGFIGLGIMGTAMARNLLKSGKFISVYVWNRTLSKAGGHTLWCSSLQRQQLCMQLFVLVSSRLTPILLNIGWLA